MRLEIVPVTADHWSSFDEFFARQKLECYCRWPREEPMTFKPEERKQRDAMRELVLAGNCPGLLACDVSGPVGWCAVAPKREFPQYADITEGAWGIACVTVGREARGAGVGRRLVEAAISYATEHGARSLDGPPPWWKAGSDAERAAVIHILTEAGFEYVDDGARMPVLRKVLR